MENIPVDIEIAFMDQIDSAAQNWHDGVTDYKDFRRSLRNHCRNIFNAGLKTERQPCPHCGESGCHWLLHG